MGFLGDIFLLVFLFFFIYSAEKWAKSIKKSTEKTAKQLEISFFPVVDYRHFEYLGEEINFWQKWSEKYRKLEEKYSEKDKKEEEKYTKLLNGCGEIIGIFYKLQRKAQEANIAALNGKAVEKAMDKYWDFWWNQEEKINRKEDKLKEIDKELSNEIMVRDLDYEFGAKTKW